MELIIIIIHTKQWTATITLHKSINQFNGITLTFGVFSSWFAGARWLKIKRPVKTTAELERFKLIPEIEYQISRNSTIFPGIYETFYPIQYRQFIIN